MKNSTLAAVENELVTSRRFDAPRDEVFRAFIEPESLRRWWGPKGFTNTFEEFDPRVGGNWRFIMHGPNGANYPNHHIFMEIVRPERLVLVHLSRPQFEIAFTLTEEDGGTRLEWRMKFATAEECARIKTYAAEANEQNLDRLGVEIRKMASLAVKET
jgi:uncharacterized protein YndB with AHSA1/START domain